MASYLTGVTSSTGLEDSRASESGVDTMTEEEEVLDQSEDVFGVSSRSNFSS